MNCRKTAGKCAISLKLCSKQINFIAERLSRQINLRTAVTTLPFLYILSKRICLSPEKHKTKQNCRLISHKRNFQGKWTYCMISHWFCQRKQICHLYWRLRSENGLFISAEGFRNRQQVCTFLWWRVPTNAADGIGRQSKSGIRAVDCYDFYQIGDFLRRILRLNILTGIQCKI